MSKPIITIDKLSKAYRIGHVDRYRTLRQALTDAAKAPFRRLRSGRPGATETFWALKDASFEVQRGEVVGIIGRNGAGKSTLLKVLSRITEPTSGEVRMRGRVASLLEVGTGFHPELTGRENIYLNGAILGMKGTEIARKFDTIVAFAEVEKFLDTPVKHYSSGMYIRLAFAVAAHLEPEVLIVDEVLSVGDTEFQRKCLGKMQEVSRGEGRTVLFVSHNMPAVRSLCHSAVLLDKGQVVVRGDTVACVEAYLHSLSTGGSSATINPVCPPHAPLWIEAARFQADGEPTLSVLMGQSAALEVDFAAQETKRNICLGVTIHDSDGMALIYTSNFFQDPRTYDTPVLRGTVRCDLGVLPLVAGRYYVTASLGDRYKDSHVIDQMFCFEVVARDIWGTGHTPESEMSRLWWPSRFTLG